MISFVMIDLIMSGSYFFMPTIALVCVLFCGSNSICQIWQRQADVSSTGWLGVFTRLCWDSHKHGRVDQNPLASTQCQPKALLLEIFLCWCLCPHVHAWACFVYTYFYLFCVNTCLSKYWSVGRWFNSCPNGACVYSCRSVGRVGRSIGRVRGSEVALGWG